MWAWPCWRARQDLKALSGLCGGRQATRDGAPLPFRHERRDRHRYDDRGNGPPTRNRCRFDHIGHPTTQHARSFTDRAVPLTTAPFQSNVDARPPAIPTNRSVSVCERSWGSLSGFGVGISA
jgi:hypothetical protein